MKRFLSMFFAIITVYSCGISTAFAADLQNQNQETMITNSNASEKETLTNFEMKHIFLSYDPSFFAGKDVLGDLMDTATNETFLKGLIRFTKNKYCFYDGREFVYPAGDSKWLSKDEWDTLTTDLQAPISESTVRMVLERTQKMNSFWNQHETITSSDELMSLIRTCVPDLLPLVEGNEDRLGEWIRLAREMEPVTNYNCVTILHELAHELSAVKENVFKSRTINWATWSVQQSGRPSDFVYYVAKNQDWASVHASTIVRTKGLIDEESIPEYLKKQWYPSTYFADRASSNLYGIYGVMDEFCSVALDVRMSTIYRSMLGTTNSYLDRLIQSDYSWWRGVTLHYFAELENSSPIEYQNLMKNKELVQCVVDTISYCESQLNLIQDDGTLFGEEITEWAWTGEDVQKQWNQLDSLANQFEKSQETIDPVFVL